MVVGYLHNRSDNVPSCWRFRWDPLKINKPGTNLPRCAHSSMVCFVRLDVLYTSSRGWLAIYMLAGRDVERCTVEHEYLDIPKSTFVTPSMVGSSKHMTLLCTSQVNDTTSSSLPLSRPLVNLLVCIQHLVFYSREYGISPHPSSFPVLLQPSPIRFAKSKLLSTIAQNVVRKLVDSIPSNLFPKSLSIVISS